eukprot:5217799-Amphidinium_carterae.2
MHIPFPCLPPSGVELLVFPVGTNHQLLAAEPRRILSWTELLGMVLRLFVWCRSNLQIQWQ